jgi:carbonic anhydrase
MRKHPPRHPLARLAPLLALAIALAPASALGADAGWGYEGEVGPEQWGTLSPDYAACASGLEQSPIDIPADAPVVSEDIVTSYGETALTIQNNGHAIQVNADEGSTARIDGIEYALLQFHFHSPSEHTLAGESTEMELHLVHSDEAGSLAVLGVMLVEGDENAAYHPIRAALPLEEGDPVTVDGVLVDVESLLPQDRSAVGYPGSLTTPPCTEGVTWHVFTEAVEISPDQLAAFRAVHDGTNRPVQPLNDREFDAP